MRKLFFLALLFCSLHSTAQSTDTTQWLRAFPITDYIVNLSDTVKLVQVKLTGGQSLKEKQMAVLRGVYMGDKSDTVSKGYGRCNLVKGDYYYFTIGNNKSGKDPKEGDLLYTFVPKTGSYAKQALRIALHHIGLQDVYEKPFYDIDQLLVQWTSADEKAMLDSMIADIHFTGDYFLENSPSMNMPIEKGDYKGRKVLNAMIESKQADVEAFLDYMIARPRLYAGRKWKMAEVFATWLSEGGPKVIKN